MEKMAAEGGQHPNQQMTFSGSVMVKEPGGWLAKGGTPIITGQRCGVCLIVVLMTVVFVMAFLALVLVLSVMTQAYPVCDCTMSEWVGGEYMHRGNSKDTTRTVFNIGHFGIVSCIFYASTCKCR